MKLAANYTIFYGEDFIEYSLRSIYPFMDYIFIALGEKSWIGRGGLRRLPIDNVRKKIRHFIKHEDKDKKVRLYEGVWNDDTEQRNFLLDKCRGKVDYAFLVDSDEVWEYKILEGLIKQIRKNNRRKEPPNLYRVGIYQYYRSLKYRFKDEIHRVDYVYRITPDVRHDWIRRPGTESGKDIKEETIPVYYHHYGYAYPTKIIEKKVDFWGHYGEVPPDWFTHRFRTWTPDEMAYSPTGQEWPTKKCKVVDEMKDHPFAKLEIIP
jgi:hypothetical protein